MGIRKNADDQKQSPDSECSANVVIGNASNNVDVAGNSQTLNVEEESWKTHPISVFEEKYRGHQPEDRELPRKVRSFYKSQDKLIRDLQITSSLVEHTMGDTEETCVLPEKQDRRNNILIKLTFFMNLLLTISKMTASIFSGSLSVISSLMDSIVDLTSGLTLWFTARQMKKSLPYSYPTGRKRLEPIAVIVLSVIMSSVSAQIIIQAIQTIVSMATKNEGPPNMTNATIGLVAFTIVTKAVLLLLCWMFGRGQSLSALKNDQLNDCLSNSIALVCSTISSRIGGVPQLKYMDPCGAILIGIYIIFSWWKIAAVHVRNLSGRSADPAFIQKITFICVNHHSSIERLDTVRAFHFGVNYMVEIDIVLPRDMDLHLAHDIGETLQQKLESLQEVERAFVHLDYECTHNPQLEHKVN